MTGYRGVYDPVGAVAVSEEERQREVAGIREAASSRSWSRAGSVAKRLLGSLGLGSSRRLHAEWAALCWGLRVGVLWLSWVVGY